MTDTLKPTNRQGGLVHVTGAEDRAVFVSIPNPQTIHLSVQNKGRNHTATLTRAQAVTLARGILDALGAKDWR